MQKNSAGSAVKYKQFIIEAFEQAPGKWRAGIKRSDGTPLMVVGPNRVKLDQSIAGIDSLTAEDALLVAVTAIDAGAFSHRSALRLTSSGSMAL